MPKRRFPLPAFHGVNKRKSGVGKFAQRLERLETRVVLDAAFANLANLVDSNLAALAEDLPGLVRSTVNIPVLGKELDEFAGSATAAMTSLQTDLKQRLNELNLNDANLEEGLRNTLASAGLLHDIGDFGFQDDVNVERFASGQIEITLNLAKQMQGLPAFVFNTGLPGLGFRVASGGLDVSAAIAYDRLTVGINPDQSPYFRSDLYNDEFKVKVGAGLKAGGQVTADLGFLSVSATDATPNRNEIEISLVADIRGDSPVTISPSSPRLQGDVDVRLALVANFDTANLESNAQYPSIKSTFVMQWHFADASADSSLQQLGATPNIRFENVTINVGSFLNSMIGPVARTIRDIMRPFDPILKIITTEIPLLSPIGKEVGLGPVTLKSLAIVAGETAPLPPDYDLLLDLFNAVTSLHDLLIRLDTRSGALELNVGSFDLSGKDPRTAKFDASLNSVNLTDLIPRAVGELRSVAQQLQEDLPAELKPIFTLVDQRLRSAQNGAGFNFPIFDDPMTGIFKLLLGQDTDFVNYTASFHVDGNRTQLLPLPIPLLPNIVNVRLNVQYDADAYLKVGYDTYGLRRFLKTTEASQLANGLYVDASRPLLSMSGSVSAGLAVSLIPNVNIPVLGVEIPTPPNISINGELSLNDVVVGFGGGAAKLRLLESTPEPLFNTQGLVKAGFTFVAEAGIPGVATLELYKEVLSEVVLFDLYAGPLASPNNPFNDTPSNDVEGARTLVLDLNREPGLRLFQRGPGNDGAADLVDVRTERGDVVVRVNGDIYRRRALALTKDVKIIGSEDDDSLVVEGKLHLPVKFEGGLGSNSVTLDDRGFGGNMSLKYTVTSGQMRRSATDSLGRFNLGVTNISHSQTESLTLYTSNVQGASVQVSSLYNNTVDIALGRFDNSVVIDSTTGGWADSVILRSPIAFPFRPLGNTRLEVRDRIDAANVLHGRSRYVATDERLTRKKLMPLNFGALGLQGGVGALTVDYRGVKINDFAILGGDRGNDFDIQSISVAGKYRVAGGGGADHFTVGQLHPTLPGGTGNERQLGFVGANFTMTGGGGLLDTLVLDDTASDLLPYVVRNTYDVYANLVDLQSTQDFGAASNTIQGKFFYSSIEDVTIKTGGTNTINIHDTVSALSGIFERGRTSIISGQGNDTVNVLKTRGSLSVDTGGGSNFVTIGGSLNQQGNLNAISGVVSLVGDSPSALNFVTIMDASSNSRNNYSLDASQFSRSNAGGAKYVAFDGMAIHSLSVFGGTRRNQFRIDGTPSQGSVSGLGVDIRGGASDDTIVIRGSNSPLVIDLAGGKNQSVYLGDKTASLDGVRGSVFLSGSGVIEAFISNEASRTQDYININRDVLADQTFERYALVDGLPRTLNNVRFNQFGELRLNYSAGMGGDTTYISAVDQQASVTINGASGIRETFGVGFGADLSKILGPVLVNGQSKDGDYAYYYDFLNPSPGIYQFALDSVDHSRLIATRSGIASVAFDDLAFVEFLAPLVGASTVDVAGLAATTTLGIFASADSVTLGAFTTDGCPCVDVPLQRSLQELQGAVNVVAYNENSQVRLLVDDSGNSDITARNIQLVPASPEGFGATLVSGLPMSSLSWNMGPTSYVQILGGAANETFALTRNPSVAALAIDGGGGVNTLDYLSAWDRQVTAAEDGALVNLASGTATGARGGIARFQNVIGSPGNDILVGNGGNTLNGGEGRDILIAGAADSILGGGSGEDLLIAGSTSFDQNPTALVAIQDEWVRDDLSYLDRTANLTTFNGGLMPKLIVGQTVTGNGGGNSLLGGLDSLDLLFASSDLDVTDASENELLIEL